MRPMKTLRVVFLAAISGCASPGADLSDVSFDGREPACTRQCLATYSECSSQAARTFARDVSDNILSACKASLRACVATCERR